MNSSQSTSKYNSNVSKESCEIESSDDITGDDDIIIREDDNVTRDDDNIIRDEAASTMDSERVSEEVI